MMQAWQMDLLKDIFPQIVIDSPYGEEYASEPNAAPEVVALYYRTRFEAAEVRYGRMKGLVRAALEKVHCIEQENRDLRVAGALAGLGLQPLHFNSLLSTFVGGRQDADATKAGVASLVLELERVRGDNARLIEHSRAHRGGGMVEDKELRALFESAIAEAKEYKPTIAKLRAQISAMEFDWTQAKTLRDELFDYEDKLRECEFAAGVLCLDRKPIKGAKVFAVSHRHMLEIIVEHRNRNINGYFAHRVVTVEKMRLEKDAEILELRKMVRMLELASGVSRVEMDERLVPDEMELIERRSELDSVNRTIRAGEARSEELNASIKSLEDHASDWHIAHARASEFIDKAEKMRSEYDGMMASIRSAEAKLAERRRGSGRDVEELNTRMRGIMEEIDDVEGEIAVKGNVLERLKTQCMAKEKTIDELKGRLAALDQEFPLLSARLEQRAAIDHLTGDNNLV